MHQRLQQIANLRKRRAKFIQQEDNAVTVVKESKPLPKQIDCGLDRARQRPLHTRDIKSLPFKRLCLMDSPPRVAGWRHRGRRLLRAWRCSPGTLAPPCPTSSSSESTHQRGPARSRFNSKAGTEQVQRSSATKTLRQHQNQVDGQKVANEQESSAQKRAQLCEETNAPKTSSNNKVDHSIRSPRDQKSSEEQTTLIRCNTGGPCSTIGRVCAVRLGSLRLACLPSAS